MLTLRWNVAVACGKEDKEKEYTVREYKGKMMTQKQNKQTKHQNDVADPVFPLNSVVSITTKQSFFGNVVDITLLSPPLCCPYNIFIL